MRIINHSRGQTMTRSITLLAGAAIVAAALGGVAYSQGMPPVVAASPVLSAVKIDLPLLASGYRVSKVVGSTVVNAANDTVGTLDDLIVTPNDKVSFAVLSIGGFLGVDTRYVVLPYSAFELRDKHLVLRDGSKETLKALPEFKYGT
jgi:hypothetical protein